MSKATVAVFVAVTLVAAVGFVIAQESTPGPAGGRGPQGGLMGEWFDDLTKAYEQKDMDKIGQLLDQIKQRRQEFQRRIGGGGPGSRPQGMRGPGGRGPGRPQADTQSALDSSPLAKTDAEKKILSVLDEMGKDPGRRSASVSLNDGRLLRLLTEAVGAKRVIEIGTSTGYSGLWFALGLRSTGGKLITHEINTERAKMARQNFKEAGVSNLITIIEGDAHETVKQHKDPTDILFLDADKEGYIDYLNKLLPLVRSGGLVVAHNMRFPRADPRYVKAITTNPDLETLLVLEQGAGVSVTLKKR